MEDFYSMLEEKEAEYTKEELQEKDTSNKDMTIFSPQNFGVQTKSKAFD